MWRKLFCIFLRLRCVPQGVQPYINTYTSGDTNLKETMPEKIEREIFTNKEQKSYLGGSLEMIGRVMKTKHGAKAKEDKDC